MIVHIIYNDSKFVDNYISFFNTNFSDLEFYYVLYGRGKPEDIKKFKNNKNIIVINKLYSLGKMVRTKRLMKKADKIIISGIFGIELFLYLIFSKYIWNKIYLHFWGGDFYRFRESSKNKVFMTNALKKCFCLIMSNEDYHDCYDIFHIEKKCMYAIAPCYDYDVCKYAELYNKKNTKKILKIFLGNSGAIENQHIEALELLSKYKSENILIYCPLSYGDEKYIEKVIKKGNDIFNNQFIPLIDFIEYNKYLKILSSCNIAIYNHNCQMAFGNIMMSLFFGLKIYVNKKNTLLQHFYDLGCYIYDIQDLSNRDSGDVILFSDENRKTNNNIIYELKDNVIKQWSIILK